jgi:hypothetical protein
MLTCSNPRIVEQSFQDVGVKFRFMEHIRDMDAKLIAGLSCDN